MKQQGKYFAEPLNVCVRDGRLLISIGVQTLAHAVTRAEWANPWRDAGNETGGDYRREFVILDARELAVDVTLAMQAESEDGSTPLTRFIDTMAQAAIEDGSLATDDAAEGGIPYEGTDPRETWASEPQEPPR